MLGIIILIGVPLHDFGYWKFIALKLEGQITKGENLEDQNKILELSCYNAAP